MSLFVISIIVAIPLFSYSMDSATSLQVIFFAQIFSSIFFRVYYYFSSSTKLSLGSIFWNSTSLVLIKEYWSLHSAINYNVCFKSNSIFSICFNESSVSFLRSRQSLLTPTVPFVTNKLCNLFMVSNLLRFATISILFIVSDYKKVKETWFKFYHFSE